jgi:hypothetical protein
VALVVLVIFLFLKHAAATIIPALSLPVSLIGAFFILYWMGYSLDNVSLLGLSDSDGNSDDDEPTKKKKLDTKAAKAQAKIDKQRVDDTKQRNDDARRQRVAVEEDSDSVQG